MTIRAASLSLLIAVVYATPAAADAFDRLVDKGYAVSKLSQGKSGLKGWYLTKKGEPRMFCRMDVSMAINGKNYIGFTTADREVGINGPTYREYLAARGAKPDPMPQYSDLKAGRVDGRWVGACSKAK